MALLEINWRPDRKQLRQFGLAAAPLLPLGAWCVTTETSVIRWLWSGTPLLWDSGNLTIVALAAVIGALAATLAIAKPELHKFPFLFLSILTSPIGMVLGEVLVAVIYFGIFTPLAVLFGLLGRRPLDWRLNRQAATYWQPKKYRRTPASYFQQF
ncbi:MAG: hypothetical protein ACKVP0_12835 [Pirellulaceae bacterium]